MVFAPREFVVDYGGFVVGADSTRQVDIEEGPFTVERDFERFTVEFSFIIRQATATLFSAEVAAVEAAFRKPRGNLTITINGVVQYTFSHLTSTGFDAEPRVVKRGAVADSGTMRTYRVRVRVALPADNLEVTDGSLGLRRSTVNVARDPARVRTITIAGEYTGSTANPTARDQYEAQISAYATAVLNTFPGIFHELDDEPGAEADDTDHTSSARYGKGKVLRFSRVFREVIYQQGPGAALDDPQITRQELRIARRREAPGDTPDAVRLVEAFVTWSAWVNADTSAGGTRDLRAKWTSYRPWIIQQAKDTLADFRASVAVVEERPEFDYTANRITATMRLLSTVSGGTPVERRVTTEDFFASGKVLVSAWTGNPLSKYDYDGPATSIRTVTEVVKGVGQEFSTARPATPDKAVFISTREARTPLRLGFREDDGFFVSEVTRTTIFELFEPIEVATGPTIIGRGRTVVVVNP